MTSTAPPRARADASHHTPRLLTDTADLRSHLDRHGLPPRRTPAELVDDVERAGLTGRGGAAFPVHRKLRAVAGTGRSVVVGNGAEGDPASAKDAALLARAPHLVLDGVQAAARAVGADRAVLYVRPGPAVGAVRAAIRERRDAGLDDRVVELVAAAGTFVSGQESAVVRAVDGGSALPRSAPPRVFDRGVGGRPTLVQNVETLAHLALVERYGPQWFRQAGTAAEPGTMLCTISGAVDRPGVVEVPLGTPLAAVLDGADACVPLRGLLVGGYHGGWLAPAEAARLSLSAADLAPLGAAPGAGVLIALGAQDCPLEVSARIVRYLADSSARQCGPCVNGLPALAGSLAGLAGRSWPPSVLARVRELTGLVAGRGACAHPDGTVRLVRSVLRAFPDEIAAHAAGHCTRTARPAGAR